MRDRDQLLAADLDFLLARVKRSGVDAEERRRKNQCKRRRSHRPRTYTLHCMRINASSNHASRTLAADRFPNGNDTLPIVFLETISIFSRISTYNKYQCAEMLEKEEKNRSSLNDDLYVRGISLTF